MLYRRFGIAKRLKQIMDFIENFYINKNFMSFKFLYNIQYYLSFGSAKPTADLVFQNVKYGNK